MAVAGLAWLEHNVGRLETRDGFFTCWEPFDASPSAPASLQSCGLLPRLEITPGAFQSILPGTRYLNVPRLSAVLGGPIVLLGLVIATALWVVAGYRSTASRERAPELRQRPSIPSPSALSLSTPNDAQAWLTALPRRWARNAAFAGGTIALLGIQPILTIKGTATASILILEVVVISLGSAALAYLCGAWARRSLRAPFGLSPTSAMSEIRPNWLMGAIILAALLLASDISIGWRGTTPLFKTAFDPRDMGYLVGFFGTWLFLGYLTALMSQRGLRQAIDADRKRLSALRVPDEVPGDAPLHRQYSLR